jgi:hypothetical protein
MNKFFLILFTIPFAIPSFAQTTPFEASKGQNTATYPECIKYYEQLDLAHDELKMLSYGTTDVGKPLNLVVLSKNKIFDPKILQKQNKSILLINNAIHPGEPEGVDASMILARELLKNKAIPENLVICIIPIYNIGGSLNRSSFSRANQNGPESYGFRGNAQNLDLNRDFIKTDSKNSHAFQLIFNEWNPDVFVDTHVSNGADYQYVMTLIETQKDKLNPILSQYMTQNLVPNLYKEMKNVGFEMTPYVDHLYETPDSGIVGFLETPRYATGYTTLHNTIGFITETHMLKPFEQREASTYAFLDIIIKEVSKNSDLIKATRKKADEQVKNQTIFPLSWTMNKDSLKMINFKGFEGKHKPSEVSGKPRLYYNRNEPFEKKIAQYNKFDVVESITKPLAYILPQGWTKAVELLKLNKVEMQRLKRDTTLNVEMYYIEDYKTGQRPYEGHYLHSGVKLKKVNMPVNFYEGDYVIYTNQIKNRYLIETLEPQATDSFFAWNFFDSILGQKEVFSAYVFEDLAADLLKKDPKLKVELDQAKAKDERLRNSGSAQLNWVYQHSLYYEKTHLRYPIARLLNPSKLVIQ